jgi:hypothetical protein
MIKILYVNSFSLTFIVNKIEYMPRFFIHPDIAKAKTIDTEYYTSTKCYEESKERIFAKSWQLIGDADKIKEAGAAYPFCPARRLSQRAFIAYKR